MIIHGNEIMEPEELSELGRLFDEACAALNATAGQDGAELRTALASTLLKLAHLRQLSPDQMKATALRIFRCEPVQQSHSVAPAVGLHQPPSLTAEAASGVAFAAVAGPPTSA
jgi:hypothetical protein